MSMQQLWEKKSRFLTQLLIWSGALNIGLLSSFVYFVLKDRPETKPFELEPAHSRPLVLTYQEMLTTFSTLSWAELTALLDATDHVEGGYTQRDLALASLVAFHGFDIERALQGMTLQKRWVVFARKGGPEEIHLTLYPGLTEDHFHAVKRFILTETFPFTSQGIFYEVQRSVPPYDDALLEAFYLTPEFNSIFTLCQRSGMILPRPLLVAMIAQGEWKIIHQFAEEQKQSLDLTADRLKQLLLKFTRCRSLVAAKILLQWDREFLLKKIEDRDLTLFIDLFSQPFPLLHTFLKEVLTTPRSDGVWKKAAEKLYLFAQIEPPDPYDHQAALATFIGGAVAPPQPIPTPIVEERKHVIQKGDNLWKIARKYHVSIDALREANHLESDKLREGKTLILPSKEG